MKFLNIIGLIGVLKCVSACAGPWAQCGGNGFSGEACCVSGYTCVESNQWFSQCQPGSNAAPATSNAAANDVFGNNNNGGNNGGWPGFNNNNNNNNGGWNNNNNNNSWNNNNNNGGWPSFDNNNNNNNNNNNAGNGWQSNPIDTNINTNPVQGPISTTDAPVFNNGQTTNNAPATNNAPVATSNSSYPKGSGIQVYTQCKNPKHWAMTYDDGPYIHDGKILDLMKEKGVKATFFASSMYRDINSAESQANLKRMNAEGHIIGNHSASHPYLTNISADEIKKEMKAIEDGVFAAIGKRPAFMRPPYGSTNQNVLNTLQGLGYVAAINWNVDPMDYSNGGDINYAKSAFQGKVGQGVISLNHLQFNGANDQNIVALAKAEIELMLSNGYTSVTMEECLGMSAYQ